LEKHFMEEELQVSSSAFRNLGNASENYSAPELQAHQRVSTSKQTTQVPPSRGAMKSQRQLEGMNLL
jgi:hypothetical protein